MLSQLHILKFQVIRWNAVFEDGKMKQEVIDFYYDLRHHTYSTILVLCGAAILVYGEPNSSKFPSYVVELGSICVLSLTLFEKAYKLRQEETKMMQKKLQKRFDKPDEKGKPNKD
jgi:hypothetical protein